MLSHFKITVTGKVQGVFFRASTQRQAAILSLKGFVRNQLDGTVYIEVEGDAQHLTELVEWCQAGGPPGAHVSNVDIEEGELIGYDEFSVRR